MTDDWDLFRIQRQLRHARAERKRLDIRATRAEEVGVPELAARFKTARTQPHLDAYHERHALDKPPAHDAYLGSRLVDHYEAIRRLAIIGTNRPGHLLDTVHTELNLLARKHPDLAERGRVALSGIAPEDRRYDPALIVIRQALGRLVSLGWPRRQATVAVTRLEGCGVTAPPGPPRRLRRPQ